MAQAYTAPDWENGAGISVSNLQAISNVLENIVQGTDKAIHNVDLNGSNLVVTYVDGTTETFAISGLKGIASVNKTSSGNVDTYTITYTDGTTYSFNVTNASGQVIANPTLSGGESNLTALEVDGTKYKIPSGGGGGSASIEYGDETAYNTWSQTATDGEVFIRTDDNEISQDITNLTCDGTKVVSIDSNATKVTVYPSMKLCVYTLYFKVGTLNTSSHWSTVISGLPKASVEHYNLTQNTSNADQNGLGIRINASGNMVFTNKTNNYPSANSNLAVSGCYVYSQL